MAWFDRCRGELEAGPAAARLSAAVTAAGVTEAVALACGPVGLRRFVVRFDQKGGRLRVTGLESERLVGGGGPPSSATFDAAAVTIEATLATLKRSLTAPFAFTRGALGVLRDGEGELDITFRFDEDGDVFGLRNLPMPEGESAPIENPDYLRALQFWEGRIAPVRARWIVPRVDAWEWADGWLQLGDERLRVDPIAMFHAGQTRFEWMVDSPVGDEAPFVEPELTVEMGAAMELAVFAAARMGCVGIVQGTTDNGMVWFGGVRA